MAEATRHAKVTETVEVVKEEEHIMLKLTMAEARALFALTNRVGGSPGNSPRGLIDNVNEAIHKAHEGAKYDRWEWGWAEPEFECFQNGIGITAKLYKHLRANS